MTSTQWFPPDKAEPWIILMIYLAIKKFPCLLFSPYIYDIQINSSYYIWSDTQDTVTHAAVAASGGDGSKFAVLACPTREANAREQDGIILLFEVDDLVPMSTWSVKKVYFFTFWVHCLWVPHDWKFILMLCL